jgi:nitroreductase
MLLGAVEQGLGGCILGAVNREGLRRDLQIEAHLDILLVLALGKPKEEVRLEYIEAGGDTTYWRDADGVHHVPKRPLEEIILKEFA